MNELRLRSAEVIALDRLRRDHVEGLNGDAPDELWKTIPALFGFPVETGVEPLSGRPWLTWSLALLIAAVSLLAFGDFESVVDRFGFVPAHAFRLAGLTPVTAFLLHGGLWHLIGNLYFLLVFGDNVEHHLGRKRTLMLIGAATFVGDAVHALWQPGSLVPCIGASGGISGIIVFYALQFPHARLGFLVRPSAFYFRIHWLQLPAWGALLLWLLLQCWGVFAELSGFSNVAATAHLGGAAAGFLAWLAWRKLETEAA